MTDIIQAVRAKSDKTRVTIVTRGFVFEGWMHTPKVGKESRRISDTLNADRNFINVTEVTVTHIATGKKDPTVHPMLQVALNAVEYVKPHFDEDT